MDQNEKITFAINKFKEMIHNIELAVKSKEYENIDLEREIKKMELVNQKITQLNLNTEESITNTQKNNEITVNEIFDLESKIETYEKLIDAKEKQNK